MHNTDPESLQKSATNNGSRFEIVLRVSLRERVVLNTVNFLLICFSKKCFGFFFTGRSAEDMWLGKKMDPIFTLFTMGQKYYP